MLALIAPAPVSTSDRFVLPDRPPIVKLVMPGLNRTLPTTVIFSVLFCRALVLPRMSVPAPVTLVVPENVLFPAKVWLVPAPPLTFRLRAPPPAPSAKIALSSGLPTVAMVSVAGVAFPLTRRPVEPLEFVVAQVKLDPFNDTAP